MSGADEGVLVLIGDAVPAVFSGDEGVDEVGVASVITQVRSPRVEEDSGDDERRLERGRRCGVKKGVAGVSFGFVPSVSEGFSVCSIQETNTPSFIKNSRRPRRLDSEFQELTSEQCQIEALAWQCRQLPASPDWPPSMAPVEWSSSELSLPSSRGRPPLFSWDSVPLSCRLHKVMPPKKCGRDQGSGTGCSHTAFPDHGDGKPSVEVESSQSESISQEELKTTIREMQEMLRILRQGIHVNHGGNANIALASPVEQVAMEGDQSTKYINLMVVDRITIMVITLQMEGNQSTKYSVDDALLS
ncbi:hypothetical protein GUJ93_ZPchr0004g39701 [Zizania palustris]|uniref:Uncharacterized protein n=1 Tax=Zizania palustris TaxID=103762 RepID=A0A8J5VZV5_ZIZPA|nr:hypothetical protein GUJ93_ZPchr0004g39701 [Zizania palustris]